MIIFININNVYVYIFSPPLKVFFYLFSFLYFHNHNNFIIYFCCRLMDRHHSKHHYSKNKNHRSRSHSHEKDKYRDEKQENTSHAKEMKMDKIIFFLADDENNPKKLKLYEYYTKFIAFKTKFKQEMAKFQPEPAHQDKIWG